MILGQFYFSCKRLIVHVRLYLSKTSSTVCYMHHILKVTLKMTLGSCFFVCFLLSWTLSSSVKTFDIYYTNYLWGENWFFFPKGKIELLFLLQVDSAINASTKKVIHFLESSFSSYLLELLHKRQNLCKCFVEVQYALTKRETWLLFPLL